MSRKLGRAEVRRGRIGRKAHRHIERNSLSVVGDSVVVLNRSQRVDGRVVRRQYIGRDYAQQVRENMGIVGRDWIRPVSIGFVREFVPVRLRDEVSQPYAAKSFLVVRLKPDETLRFGDRRIRLAEMACRQKFVATSVYGPIAFVDDERNVVDIRLRGTDFKKLANKLIAVRWVQSINKPEMFRKRNSPQSRRFAVEFCEANAGEWFTLRGVNEATLTCLYRSGWLEVFDHTRALPGNGTTEHLLSAHPFRKPKARSKSDLCDGRYTGDGEGIMAIPLKKSPRCGLTAAEVAASRRNNNGVKYLPKIAPRHPRMVELPSMSSAGVYDHDLRCERSRDLNRSILNSASAKS